ncbi:reprolysin-like metallopeptidase [Wenzhouxiangella marina]|nr:zinc-dependent metalloprotease family protein [Wenzhouxiangella marina]
MIVAMIAALIALPFALQSTSEPSPPTESADAPSAAEAIAPDLPEDAAPELAWQLDDSPRSASALAVSGLEQWPGERLLQIRAAARPRGDWLSLDLGPAGRIAGPVQRRVAHANGDESLLVRDGGHEALPRALLTWGEEGLFGRIQTEQGLFLVHSDAAGSWLVDVNDPKLSVDAFEHDVLEPSARTIASTAASMASGQEAIAQPASDDAHLIDVMFAYPPSMVERYPDGLITTRLNHLVAIANQTFVDTQVPVAVRLVGQTLVDYRASEENGETLGNLQQALAGNPVAGLGTLAAQRNALGADIVAFTWPHDIETRGSCGIAFFPFFENGRYDPSYGVHIDNDGFSNWSVCSDSVFTHELGHNLNAEHQRSRSSGDDPERSNYAWIRFGELHSIMGSFGTGDQDRYRRLDVFSNPAIQCGGAPCGSSAPGTGANNAAEILQLAPILASYRGSISSESVSRPGPSALDQDQDGQLDRDDPFPFDPFDGQGDPDPDPALVFSPRALADEADTDQELLVVSSGSNEVLAFGIDGEFRSVALRPERVNPGPILTGYSDLIADSEGRLYLLANGDVRRYDRLSGRLIDVFLGSQRPEPNDLLSAFPRAMATLPNNQFVVLGDTAIERYSADQGRLLTRLQGAEPTREPANWNEQLDLALRAAAHIALRLYVAEATGNRILAFSAATGQRLPDLAGPDNGRIVDPWDLAFDAQGRLYLANGEAANVLRYDLNAGFLDEFIPSGRGGLIHARALAFGPEGDLYVADRERDAVLRYDGETGAFLETVVEPGANGLDAPVSLAFSARIDQTVAGTSGHFFAPERAGEGWLVERLNDNTAAMSWFTYPPDSDAEAEQAWLVGIGAIDGARMVFDEVFVSRGQGFGVDFDPDSFELVPWGQLSMEFHDCNAGVAHWTGPEDWGSGEQRFDRLIEIPGLPCGSEPRPAEPARPGVSGQWFEPQRSGQGWFIEEVADGALFVAWYSYDAQGHQQWLVGNGEIAEGIAHFPEMLRPVGTRFGSAFDPGEVVLEPWGSLTIRFTDCLNAVAEYQAIDPTVGAGMLFPERLTQLEQLDCAIP